MSFELPENIRQVPVIARVSESDLDLDLIRTAMARSGREASLSPVGPNGHPRMLKITAWICHAGKPNRNRDAFTEEDLKAAVQNGLFGAPYFGAIDWNHDFQPYGVFYSAKYAWDPVAEAWGILAEGALFAWRYEELADRILAMQQRNEGVIAVSMSCLAGKEEQAEDADGMYWLLREPVFFTASLLDVAPADPYGRAIATESVEDTPEEREKRLEELALASARRDNDTDEEVSMDFEVIVAQLNAAGSLTDEQASAIREALAVSERVAELESALETAQAELEAARAEEGEDLTARVAELETQVVELETARDEAVVARESAATELATATEELDELRAYRTRREGEDLTAERAERREARLAQLSEAATAALEAREEEARERLISRWTDMEQDEWEVILASLNATGAGRSYVERSREEGTLSGAADREHHRFESYRYRRQA